MNTRTLTALVVLVMLLALLGMYISQRPKEAPTGAYSQVDVPVYTAQRTLS